MAQKKLHMEINGQSIRLFDTTTAAQYLGVSKATVYAWVDNHDLQKVSINNGFIFTQEQLEACRQYKNLDRRDVNIEYAK